MRGFRLKLMVSLGALALVLSTGKLHAGEAEMESLGVEAEVSFFSRYLRNAFDFNHGDPILQPSVTYYPSSVPGLGINTLLIFGFGEDQASGDAQGFVLDEADVAIFYERELFENFTAAVEFGWYRYLSDFASASGEDDNDFELVFYTTLQLHPLLALAVNYKRGLDAGIRGNAIEAALSFEYEALEQITFLPSLGVAATNQYEIDFHFAEVLIALPVEIAVSQRLSLELLGEYHLIPFDDVFDVQDKHIFVGGITTKFSI